MFCWKWMNKEEVIETHNVENEKYQRIKKIFSKETTIYLIVALIILIFCIICFLIFNEKSEDKKPEIWQSFYFPDELEYWKEANWPIFNNYNACKEWSLNKYYNWYEAYCMKNCHDVDIENWLLRCEEVVRTRQLLPWIWDVFEWIPPNRSAPWNL